MASPDSANPPAVAAPQPAVAPVQKQRTNVYTMMLVLAFFCILTACILLYMELSLFGEYPWWDTNRSSGPSASLLLDGLRTQFWA